MRFGAAEVDAGAGEAPAPARALAPTLEDDAGAWLDEVAEGSGWTCLLDTQRPEDPLGERYPFASEFLVGGRSFLLFELQPPGAGAEG